MSFSSPPSRPEPADSEPAEPIPPTLPPSASDFVNWGEQETSLPAGPVPTFSTNPTPKREGDLPTIGHIGRYALKYKIGAEPDWILQIRRGKSIVHADENTSGTCNVADGFDIHHVE